MLVFSYRESFPAVSSREPPYYNIINSGSIEGEAAVHIRTEYRTRFRLRYVGAFLHDDYVYFVSVQSKRLSSNVLANLLISKLVRVCRGDHRYVLPNIFKCHLDKSVFWRYADCSLLIWACWTSFSFCIKSMQFYFVSYNSTADMFLLPAVSVIMKDNECEVWSAVTRITLWRGDKSVGSHYLQILHWEKNFEVLDGSSLLILIVKNTSGCFKKLNDVCRRSFFLVPL